MSSLYKLCFYVPDSHLELVKDAVFAAGAGRIGDYEHCCWQVIGEGQFRPMAGSQPYIGSEGAVEYVEEWRVELVCDEAHIRAAVAALYEAHPYEEPAWDAVALVSDLFRPAS